MSRQQNTRRVRTCTPSFTVFKPACKQIRTLEKTIMSLDELEALCLTDCEDLYQGEAAERMGVSRQTFGNILASARKKVMKMLRYGNALIIEGGNVCSCWNDENGKECTCSRGKETGISPVE